MFDKEFYPTPKEVIEMMGFDANGKVCLEPSSGKGDIIDYLNNSGAENVLCVEKEHHLAILSAAKGELIGRDWFDITADQISHVQLIVMNPPFSNADRHINHAWDIAPDGCEIYALCNWETINNNRGWARNQLTKTVEHYGLASNLGDVFSSAERTTGVNIGLVKLFKPSTDSNNDFDGFFLDDDEQERQADGLIQFNEVRAVVNTYVNAVKSFDKINGLIEQLNQTTDFLGMKPIKFEFESKSENYNITTKEAYSKMLQKQGWNYVIDKFKLRKFTTSEMMKDINRFVEQQQKYPFTMKNIYHMMDMIIQTRGQQFQKALVLAVDQLTKHIDENRYGVEGWKTNEGHMLNEKIIVPNIFERGWNNANYISVRYRSVYRDRINDLNKVICSIEGVDYNTIGDIMMMKFDDSTKIQTGVWYDFGFFEIKGFYKGTMHMKFKDRGVWERLNRAYAQAKGFDLPEKI